MREVIKEFYGVEYYIRIDKLGKIYNGYLIYVKRLSKA